MAINALRNPVPLSSTKTPVMASTSSAPLQIELRFRLPVPPSEAFSLVTYRLPEWFAMIHKLTWDNARSDRGPDEVGVSSTRTCSISGKELREDIVAFEPGRMYAYRADMTRSTMKMPIKDHLGTFDIQPDGNGSVVTWRQYFRAGWPMRRMIRWYMRNRMMVPALKTLVGKVGGEITSRG